MKRDIKACKNVTKCVTKEMNARIKLAILENTVVDLKLGWRDKNYAFSLLPLSIASFVACFMAWWRIQCNFVCVMFYIYLFIDCWYSRCKKEFEALFEKLKPGMFAKMKKVFVFLFYKHCTHVKNGCWTGVVRSYLLHNWKFI